MGLLDDAIREHLELKRRHGADPAEVARQEQEALGASRRGEFAATPEAGAPAAAAEDGARALEHEDDLDEGGPAPDAAPPAGTEEHLAPGYEEDPWLVEEDAGAEEVPHPPLHPDEEEPATPPGDAVADAGGEGAEEDVLEETPEFLQETPEHDRLWFEQRPPRDFDFD